jgi:hypothetical protein
MRNMIQLLGGVAVAGVVAAGSTAFTAAGLAGDTAFTQVVGGGKLGLTVEGATVNYVIMLSDAGDADKISGIEFTLTGTGGATLDNATSTVTAAMTGGTPVGTPTLTCAYATSKWTCDTGSGNSASKHWLAPTGLTISVVGAVT